MRWRTREDFAVDWIIVRLASRCHISLSVSGYPFLSSSKAVEAIAAKRWRSCFFKAFLMTLWPARSSSCVVVLLENDFCCLFSSEFGAVALPSPYLLHLGQSSLRRRSSSFPFLAKNGHYIAVREKSAKCEIRCNHGHTQQHQICRANSSRVADEEKHSRVQGSPARAK